MKYALIIGNDQYTDDKLSRLKTPAEDARVLEQVMSNNNIGGFKTYALINKTEADIRREMSEFLSNKKPEDLVLVYFSGHGILDSRGRLFLAFKDTRTNNLSGTALQSSFVTELMDDCRSKRQVLILDCCHSGAFARDGKKAGEQQAVTKATFEGEGYGRAVLTASSSLQFALEGNQVISQTYLSLFTHYLMEGLKTGEADKDGDGNVSLDEWFDYTYSNVVSVTSNQKPRKWIYEQEGMLLIAKNPHVKRNFPIELLQLLNNPYSEARLIAITKLAGFLRSQDSEMAKLAYASLEKLKKDKDLDVSNSAKNVLNGYNTPLLVRESTSVSTSTATPTNKKEKTSLENIFERFGVNKSVFPYDDQGKINFPKKRPLRVFISYSHKDLSTVRELYRKLRTETWIEPWLDRENLLAGMDWRLEIYKAIESTDVVLVCLSNSSISTEGYIQKELSITLDFADEKPEGILNIIPVRLEDCEPPRRLAKWHFVDYFGNNRDLGYQKILSSLKRRAESLK